MLNITIFETRIVDLALNDIWGLFDKLVPWSIIQFPSFYTAQSATKQTFLAAAIRKCGGNEEKGNLLYTAYGSNGQVCSPFVLFADTLNTIRSLLKPLIYNFIWSVF